MTGEEEVFKLPTIEDLMEEILAENTPGHMTEEASHMTEMRDKSDHLMTGESGHMTEARQESRHKAGHMTDTSHISTSYCLPYWNTSRTGLTRSFPASSCDQLLLQNATISSGHYWIDPNLGCSTDAILVYCNFTSNETCLYPAQTREVRLG